MIKLVIFLSFVYFLDLVESEFECHLHFCEFFTGRSEETHLPRCCPAVGT